MKFLFWFPILMMGCLASEKADNPFDPHAGKPATPTCTATAKSATEIEIRWSSTAKNVEAIRIERDGSTVALIKDSSYVDSGLTPGTAYAYKIAALNESGSSGKCDASAKTSSEVTEATLPAAPTNLVATATFPAEIHLTWVDNAGNETGFKVERRTGAGGTYVVITTLGAGIVSYNDTGLSASTQYYYRVHAYNGAGDSVSSNEANATTQAPPVVVPVGPSSLVAVAASDSQINLTWADNSTTEDGFKVERKIGAGGTYALSATLGANAVSYNDTGLAASTQYYYRVYAYNTAGDSGNSNEANTTTQAPPIVVPAAPSSLVAVAGGDSQINLTWADNSTTEDGFKVERKIGAGGTYALTATLDANAVSYNNTGLAASTQYYYRVYAYNTEGNSANSNEANATMPDAGGGAGAHWVSIAGGTFSMGDALDGLSDAPVHSVTLSSFEMYAYEVTNGEYQSCVAASGCTAPGSVSSYTRTPYYGNATYANYPVVNVNWQQAVDFCTWAGGRLPTEAEWEYAARGGLSGKRFPWGDTIDCTQANYYTSDILDYDVDPYVGAKSCATPGDTTQVGSYAANGGLYDMAGNVDEWVNDWYDGAYYSTSPSTDPMGPATGADRVLRGGGFGGFGGDAGGARVSSRAYYYYPFWYVYVGFRCAR